MVPVSTYDHGHMRNSLAAWVCRTHHNVSALTLILLWLRALPVLVFALKLTSCGPLD